MTPILFTASTKHDEARRFYTDVMGFTLTSDTPFALEFDAAGTMLRVQKVPDFTPHPFTAIGWRVADIASERDRLARRGASFERFEFLEARMASGLSGEEFTAVAREYAELKPVVETVLAYRSLTEEIAEAEAMLDDPEMKDLAEEELPGLRDRLPELEQAVKIALLPRDAADAKPALIEIRPGTGGEEAALFAGDLLRMYQRYAEARGWSFEVLEQSETELGGIKEVTARIAGQGGSTSIQRIRPCGSPICRPGSW